MEKDIRINLLSMLGLAVALVSFVFVPLLTIDENVLGVNYHSDIESLDVIEGRAPIQWFNSGPIPIFTTLCLVGIVLSFVTPIGGFLLLIGSLSIWYQIPHYWLRFAIPPMNHQMSYSYGSGIYLMIIASGILILSTFFRAVLVRKSFRLEYGLNNFLLGIWTVSYGEPLPRLTPKVGARMTPNLACLAGVVLGFASLAFTWENGISSRLDTSGLDMLLGNGDAPFGHALQAMLVLYLIGLVSSLYTPLGASLQLASLTAFIVGTYNLYSIGPWLGIVSSAVIAHSLLMPVRDREGVPRLAIVENLRTFRRV